jgi:hypothetical protein
VLDRALQDREPLPAFEDLGAPSDVHGGEVPGWQGWIRAVPGG